MKDTAELTMGQDSEVATLATDLLQPNDYNPNKMTDDEFAELVAEVEHLGRLPKPIIVRRTGGDGFVIIDSFVIVDGEHGWRAAKEVGLAEVPCEIIEADDFESMRQTYKRNQHGAHDPVLLGRMFRQMRELKGLSNRQLAKATDVSEGTVRNSILWADAADLRNSYAPGENRRFEQLNIRQLRWYVRMPAPIRDYWLDSGADLKPLADVDDPQDFVDSIQAFVDAGLSSFFEKRIFSSAWDIANEYREWRESVSAVIPDVDDYLRPSVERGFAIEFIDHLPFVLHKGEDPPVTIAISPDEWSAVVSDCCERAGDDDEDGRNSMIRASMRVLLKKKGVDTSDVTDPRTVELLDFLDDAPDFIKNADHMPPRERGWLHARACAPEADEDILDAAKRATVTTMKARWEYLTGRGPSNKLSEADQHRLREQWAGRTLDVVFMDEINRALHDRDLQRRDDLAGDVDRLIDETVTKFKKTYVIRTGTVDGRPATEVLRERLAAIMGPDLKLLICEFLGDVHPYLDSIAASHWLDEIGGKQADENEGE